MRHLVWIFVLAWAARAQVLDRIAVTVGKLVITESEVLTSIRVAALIDQKEPDFSGPSKRKAAERLVDQILLRREMPIAGMPADARALVSRYSSEAAYKEALEKYNVTDAEVQAQISSALTSVEAANRRFRPELQVTDEEVHAYYDKLVQGWKAQHIEKIPTFEQAQEETRNLLLNDRVSEALDQWLPMARQDANVVYREKAFE